MIDPSVLPSFIATILLFLLPPGPDMAYTLAVGLTGGRTAALKAILGIGTAMAGYATAVVLGIGRLVLAAPWALDVVRLLGAAYLVWLAVAAIRHARAAGADRSPDASLDRPRPYFRGFLVSLGNPKVILFFLAVLPQFLGDADDVTAQLAMLGAVNVAMEVGLYGSLGLFAGSIGGQLLNGARSARILQYVAAAVYLGIAIVVTVEAFAH